MTDAERLTVLVDECRISIQNQHSETLSCGGIQNQIAELWRLYSLIPAGERRITCHDIFNVTFDMITEFDV